MALVSLPREEWPILIKDAHPGYISWEEFEENQNRLKHNQQARALEWQSGPAREGPALLQGLVICGKCGRRMTLRYHQRGGRLSANHICQKQSVEQCHPVCQNVPGGVVDDALSALIVDSISPLALEWHWTSFTNSKSVWLRLTACVASMSNVHNMRPNKLAFAICGSTRYVASTVMWRRRVSPFLADDSVIFYAT